MYKHLHEYSLVIGLEVHLHSIATNMKMTSMGPDNVVFLGFYNKSIHLEGLMLGAYMHLTLDTSLIYFKIRSNHSNSYQNLQNTQKYFS